MGNEGYLSSSLDGRVLALGEDSGIIRLLETSTLQEMARYQPPIVGGIRDAWFVDGDSKLIFPLRTAAHEVFVWDLAQTRAQLADLGLEWQWNPSR